MGGKLNARQSGLKKLQFLFVIESTKPTAVFMVLCLLVKGVTKQSTVTATKRRMKRGLMC
jgi:hypothetical protein